MPGHRIDADRPSLRSGRARSGPGWDSGLEAATPLLNRGRVIERRGKIFPENREGHSGAACSISPIDCVRELAAALERGEVPPYAVRERVVAALHRVEHQGAGDELTLDAALGLSPSLWRQDQRRRRDALICAARRRYLPGVSLRAAARRIVKIARDLQTGRARSARDELTELVHQALATGAAFPSSGRQIEKMIGTGNAN